MWMTGFDVPSLLDDLPRQADAQPHPDADHRAGQPRLRRQINGLIVDYVGVFRNLQKALAIYGAGAGEGGRIDMPVKPKDELIEKLREALADTKTFCQEHGVDPDAIAAAQGFHKAAKFSDAADALMVNDETKKHFLAQANAVALLYRAILPDALAQEFAPEQALYAAIAKRIRSFAPQIDLNGVLRDIEILLDDSISSEGYVIEESEESNLIDLGTIDFDALRLRFEQGRKHVETERLRGAIERKLQRLMELNRTRVDYLQKFQDLIDEYNSGAKNVQLFFEQLVALAQDLNAEEQRAISEGLSEEELAVFDLLTKPGPKLTAKEEDQVKTLGRELLANLKKNKLVLDWRKKQTAKAQVQITIQRSLLSLPKVYNLAQSSEKASVIYQHVYDAYAGQRRSIYAPDPDRPAYA